MCVLWKSCPVGNNGVRSIYLHIESILDQICYVDCPIQFKRNCIWTVHQHIFRILYTLSCSSAGVCGSYPVYIILLQCRSMWFVSCIHYLAPVQERVVRILYTLSCSSAGACGSYLVFIILDSSIFNHVKNILVICTSSTV